jgi:hypothetical protein
MNEKLVSRVVVGSLGSDSVTDFAAGLLMALEHEESVVFVETSCIAVPLLEVRLTDDILIVLVRARLMLCPDSTLAEHTAFFTACLSQAVHLSVFGCLSLSHRNSRVLSLRRTRLGCLSDIG